MKHARPNRPPLTNLRSLARDALSAVTGGVIERDDQLLAVAAPRASEPRS